MASEQDGLIPLRREYEQAWHGFDRTQVRQYLDHVEMQLTRIIAERDSAVAQAKTLSREVENSRSEILKLRSRVDELMKPPERLEDLDERMQRSVQLASARADEILSSAKVASEEHWTATAEVSKKLRERYEKLFAELENHGNALHSEHETSLKTTQAEVRELTVHATKRREQLDAQAENKRRTIEREFEASMAAQRAELSKHIADQQTASKQQAERRIAEATAEAKKRTEEAEEAARTRIAEAKREAERVTTEAVIEVKRLAKIREEVSTQLTAASEALTRGEPMLKPVAEEATADRSPVSEKPTGEAAKPETENPDSTTQAAQSAQGATKASRVSA
jgi:chromosome segregation ATPase